MKKNKVLYVFLLLAFLLSIPAWHCLAQETDKPLVFGVKLGMSSSGFTHKHEVFTYKKLGFAGGAFCEIKPVKQIGASIELNYVQQGAFHVSSGYVYPSGMITIGNVTKYLSDITLHNLNIPVLLAFRPADGVSISPKIMAGIGFDFILSAKSKDMLYMYNPNSTPTYVTLPERTNENVTSSFKKMNYGPIVGLGLDFKGGSLVYSFEARYSVGLAHINNLATLNNVVSNTSRYDFSSNSFTVLVGVSF